MGRAGKKKQRRKGQSADARPAGWLSRHRRAVLASLFVALLVAGLGFAGHLPNRKQAPAEATARTANAPAHARQFKTLDDLLKLPAEKLGEVDIAEMNLLCAIGLPGGENLDIDRCLRRLDEWAAKVRQETQRHLYRAHDPRWADHYKHSENWLRAEFLAQVLQEDCGVHYNMERVRNIDFTRSKDLFIHGMIDDDNGGTCSSMPVLYVAVGRRLGYPLKLVTTKAHIFVRWDDGRERFNIETTSNGGTDSYPDEYYRTWPEKWTDAEARANRHLVSLAPAEELAQFLGNRGHCLLDNGHAKAAYDAYAVARKLAPQDPAYLSWMRQAADRLRPPTYAAGRQGYREPPMAYPDLMADIDRINRINAINRANMQRMTPQPPGMPQPASLYGPHSPSPGVPNPYQPYQPPIPGHPLR